MAKLNILQFICPTGFYGAERWILALARHLDTERSRCDLVVTVEGNEQLEIVSKYRDLGLQAYELPMSGRFDFSVVDKLCQLIKERDIDIIHTHGYKSDILGVIAARKAGIKSVCTPHGFENAKDLKLRAFIWLGCQSMRFFDKVVPLSKQLCEDVKRYGIKKDRLEYIQNGVDLTEVEEVRLAEMAHPASSIKRVGFIGQMISRKNIRDLLDIFNSISQQGNDIELLLLGDGEERAQLEEYAGTLPSSNKIKFLGFRDDRLDQLKQFDLFAMTSTLEGIPRCLMEAMAMEIPVAAYDIPGIDQLITHEETGLLAPHGDKQSLEAYWKKILFEPEVGQQLGTQARLFVEEKFSGKRMAKEYQELFETMMVGA